MHGSTDDTTAIQNWLNAARPNIRLVAPAGTCVFSSPLTIAATNSLKIEGMGPGVTVFQYTGLNTTADLLTIGVSTGGGHGRDTYEGFSVTSTTAMTGGYAIHAHGLYDSTFRNVWADNVNSNATGAGDLCGGFWMDGVSSVDMLNPSAFSKQNCGDGIRVNAAAIAVGAAELRIVGGAVGGVNSSGTILGFVNALHMGGGFGGLRCDQTDFHNSGVGY